MLLSSESQVTDIKRLLTSLVITLCIFTSNVSRLVCHGFLTFQSLVINTQQFYVLPTWCVNVLCTDL